jgi:hypothetical protein
MDQDRARDAKSRSATLAALFVAVFAYVREKLRGQVDMREIARVARAVLDQMHVAAGPVDWADAEPLTVGNARWIEHVRRPVRVVGRVAELQDPTVTSIPRPQGGVEHVEMTTAKIVGTDGEQLRMLEVVGRDLIEKVQAAHRSGRLHEFLGLVVIVPAAVSTKADDSASVGHFYFVPFDVREAANALDLLGASPRERADARALLGKLRSTRVAPHAFLFEQLTSNLGVVGLDQATHLVEGIDAVILQAMSTGTVGNAPARIHAMLIGPPGVGKKIVGLCARVLNPVSQEASASKITAAGLIGASHLTEDGWKSTPGLLPLAAHGVLVMQDAQGLRGAKLEQLAPILQELIEDGEVRDSVAGGRKRYAPTSTLIDLNRTSHVHVGGARDTKEVAILGVLPLLSREDVILEIPVGPEHAWALGELMYKGLRQGISAALEEQPWVRPLRLLVALLRDEHALIDTTKVVPLMEAAHRQLRAENGDFIEASPTEASALPVRLAVSFTRLVIASARAHDRGDATEADVDRAAVFVRRKLDFMRRTARLTVLMSECPGGRRAADDGFWTRRAGETVSVADVAREYVEETGTVVSTKTITRELHRHGAKNLAHGRWVLPPVEAKAESEFRETPGHPDSGTAPAASTAQGNAPTKGVLPKPETKGRKGRRRPGSSRSKPASERQARSRT